MAKKFACGDVITGCGWSTTAKDEKELFQKISEHAKNVHKMTIFQMKLFRKLNQKFKKFNIPRQ